MDHSTGTAAPTAALSVEDLCSYLRETRTADVDLLCDFARHFFAKAPRQLLQERGIEALAAMTEGAFRFLRASRPDRVSVEVVNPEEEGWAAPVTLIRAEVGDRPFIVDTIREYLAAENIAIHHYIYPVLRVVRDASGQIVGLGSLREAGTGGEHESLEALVHCEISRLPDPARREEIAAEVHRRLSDVVAATSAFPAMLQTVDHTIDHVRGYLRRFPERVDEFAEALNFLNWLRDDNFVFLGYREYRVEGEDANARLSVVPGSGLGILRREAESRWAEGVALADIPAALRERVTGGPTLIISKTNRESTVHRRARMDYIGIKELADDGRVIGERRFLGLFTSRAYAEHAESIPILRQKLEQVLRSSGSAPGSHDYKEIITIFNSMPKEELFQATTAQLAAEIQTVLSLLFADQVHVSLRPDPLRRGASVTVILPRGRFSGEVRQRIQEALERRLNGVTLSYHLAISANDQGRLHFYLSAPQETVEALDAREIEREVAQIIRSWEDRLREALAQEYDAAEAERLAALYGPAFNEEYRAVSTPESAVRDIEQMERMWREGADVAIDIRPVSAGTGAPENVSLLQFYQRDERLVLSDFMPTLDHAGVRVVEVNPAAVSGPGLPHVMLYSFLVQGPDGQPLNAATTDALSELLLAVRAGDASDDAFNALVLLAGLRWREVEVLRTYGHYAFQIGAVPARLAGARALERYPEVARLLVALFRARFDPALTAPRAEAMAEVQRQLNQAFEAVSALADDRALRRFSTLISATVRTNFYRRGGLEPSARSGGAPYTSLKIQCAEVEELKKTQLLYEMFVHSANMEGVHMRGAEVSRGGIRWSGRPDDYHTEVLGLVTTQIIKNAVIVPGGSKGGFITKRNYADRDRMGEEVAEQYRTLIRGMLDITDNIVDAQVVPPPDVVRHDGNDTYLVVAADKGTAHLSDVANAQSEAYGFWLDDAFASGGSHGYDHKKQGITARGAWECVKRHFREMGKDIQAEPFTVAGIGDMSGDVFGNGMLLSRQIKLVAAFDHRNVFLDPDPDPETSYRERERLFRLPRSSWEDYERGLLSTGGMIVPRGAKSVELTPEVQRVLGLDETVTHLDGESLIRAVLRAPVELLWNGGIGTYVKATEETNADAGDPSNDAVRINGQELRCQVVGEGGNLGFTQAARLAAALNGVRINTDALDNSAGVDMSDHEVNLKILLGALVASGEMTMEARNTLLEEMTAEVSRLVLKNNIHQSLAVSLDEERSVEALTDFAALINAFHREKVLDRGSEGLPDAETLRERAQQRIGITRPTLCVLLAFAKLTAKRQVLASTLPDDAATLPYLVHYFPPEAVEAAGVERLTRHRLRREIITTELVSDLVDLMGSSFLSRVSRDTGRSTAEVVRAWVIANHVAEAAEVRREVATLETSHSTEVAYRWLHGLSRVLERTTHWVLANVGPEADLTTVVEELRGGLTQLRGEFAAVVAGEDRDVFEHRVAELGEAGVAAALAERLITLRFLPQLLDILRIAQEAGAGVVETGRAYYLVSERFGCARLRHAIWGAATDDRWQARFAQTLVEDVERAQSSISRAVLGCGTESGGVASGRTEECLDELSRSRASAVAAYAAIFEELDAAEVVPLAGYAIAVRALMEVAGA